MIITVTKGGRTKRDETKLVNHLYGKENDYAGLVEIGNSCATTLKGVLIDARVMRNGAAAPTSKAFFHMSISPGTQWTRTALLRAVHRVRHEFDPGGTRAFAILVHGKRRASGPVRAGGPPSAEHAHLVLASVGADGAIKDRFSKNRTERIARELEFQKGLMHGRPDNPPEPPTLGAHHVAVVRALRGSASTSAIGDWLVQAFGEKPERPRSAYSSVARNRAKRKGIKLPKARAEVQRVWAESATFAAFADAISARGYRIEKGAKEASAVAKGPVHSKVR